MPGETEGRLRVAFFGVCRVCGVRADAEVDVDVAAIKVTREREALTPCGASPDGRHRPARATADVQSLEREEASLDFDVHCEACGLHGHTVAGAMTAKLEWDEALTREEFEDAKTAVVADWVDRVLVDRRQKDGKPLLS
jgi:hypothetical protein